MYAEAIHQAVVATYLAPLEKMIERRARYYIALNQKDPFAMSEEEAKKWQQKLHEIGQEIETLENVRSAIADMHEMYHKHLEKAEEAQRNVATLQHRLYQVTLDYITFRQMFETEAETTRFLLKNSIETIQKLRAA